jgi:hypothetical protein
MAIDTIPDFVSAGRKFALACTIGDVHRGLLTPSHQNDIRAFGEDLQAGKLTASEARSAIDRWGRAAYQRPVARPISARCSSSPSKAPSRSPNRSCEGRCSPREDSRGLQPRPGLTA